MTTPTLRTEPADARGTADAHVTRYRPDIDGLRALAVLAVIVFHFHRDSLAFGFLGVDIFFVLSGYLITTIIAAEMRQGRFTLRRFYERRIRRIGPALLLVLTATTAVAVAVLLPLDLVGYGKSLLAALLFVPNIYFWRDTGYFSRVAQEKPLLHTWSLGIEEQFYVLFPLILLVLLRFAPRSARYLVAGATLLSLAAYIWANQIGGYNPAFYLLPTRAWELGAGATLALFGTAKHESRWSHLIGLAGLGIVLAVLIGAPWLTPPGGEPTIPVVAGTAMMVWAGSAQPSLALSSSAWLMSRGAMVWVGKRSYSLYLWHWPAFVFVTYVLVRDLSWPEGIVLLAILFVLADLSWRFVEQPARDKSVRGATVALRCLAVAVLLAIAAIALIMLDGLPGRINAAASRANAVVGTVYRCPVQNYMSFGSSRACALNLPSGQPADSDVVLLGNSHAQMYAPLVEGMLRDAGLTGLLVPLTGCLPTVNVNIDTNCARMAAANIEAVSRLSRARVVIVAFYWDDGSLVDSAGARIDHDRMAAIVADLDRTIGRLRRAGKQVVLVGPIAAPGWDVASIVSRSLVFGRAIDRPLATPREVFYGRFDAAITHYRDSRDIVFIRPDLVQCAAGPCAYMIDGAPIFADSDHIAEPALHYFRGPFEEGLRRAGIGASPGR